jgi:hypothetical protein
MWRGVLTSGGRGGRTYWHLGGGVADAGDLVVAGDGASEGATVGDGGAIDSICKPLDGSGYRAKA